MHRFVPPLCLFVAFAMLIAGFTLWAVDPPQPSVELHRARVEADEQYRDLLEDQLSWQRLKRKVLLGALFGGSVFFAATAMLTMRGAEATPVANRTEETRQIGD